MVKVRTTEFTKDELLSIMNNQGRIRNVCIFATDDQEKSAITNALLTSSSVLRPEVASDLLDQVLDQVDDAPPGLPEWSDISLYYEMDQKSAAVYHDRAKRSADSHDDKRQDCKFLLNLNNLPVHADPSVEFSSSICISDGALLVVNCNNEIDPDIGSFLQHSLRENIVPVLCLDLIDDSRLLGYGGTGEEVYQTLSNHIKGCNKIIKERQGKLLGDVQFHPPKGNVVFSCSSSEWGFTLTTFAELWAAKLGLEPSDLVEKLWGENFFDCETEKWTRRHTGSKWCRRGFVHFCYDTVLQVMNCCINKDLTRLSEIIDIRNTVGKQNLRKINGDDLAKLVMRNWVPIGTTLLDMMIINVPAPSDAQEYRVEHMYHGPLNDDYADAIRSCDPDGPPILYVSKVVLSPETGQPLSVARLFAGNLENGRRMRIMGPKDGLMRKCPVKIFRGAIIRVGAKEEFVQKVFCGDIFGLLGFSMSTTITARDMIPSCPLRAISFTLMRNEMVDDIILKDPVHRKGSNFTIPYSVYDGLYLHQREGIHWLWSRHCKKDGGGIVADDMGLGKTRQVSAFLCGLFHSKMIKKAIVIAPSSMIDHWKPELKEVGLTSDKFDKAQDPNDLSLKSIAENGGILLSSYDSYRIHEDLIMSYIGNNFDYVFADEGHIIKNSGTKRTQALLRIKCGHKIIMTGTPVQNNLKEFHSLMLFTNPGTLDILEEFKKDFIVPIDRGKHKGAHPKLIEKSIRASEKLKDIIKPFLMRRTKDILKATGRLNANKFEVAVWVKINAFQKILYKALAKEKLLKRGDRGLAAAIVAEDICNHPLLAMPNTEASGEENLAERFREYLQNFLLKNQKVSSIDELQLDNFVSNKMELIRHIVPALLEEEHHILIFSTSPQMLIIIQDALASITEEDNVIRMDGTTSSKDRLQLINSFQSDNGPAIFLMTTKVGGFGITLTKATRVIIFDPSDNPYDDNQAVDRAYRIGQTKDVIVYRLLTCSTIEEHRYRQQILKVETSCAILEEKQCKREITKKEGYVVTDPKVGFEVSVTHQDLAEIYPNLFDRSLKSELQLVKEPDYVYDIGNHSAIFTLQEDLAPDNEYKPETRKQGIKVMENLTEKDFIQSKKTVPKELVPYLKIGKFSKEKTIQLVSGATVRISHYGDVTLTGSGDHVAKAEKLLHEIVDESKSEELSIKWEEAGAVIGARGATVAAIQDESGAHVQVNKIKIIMMNKLLLSLGLTRKLIKPRIW